MAMANNAAGNASSWIPHSGRIKKIIKVLIIDLCQGHFGSEGIYSFPHDAESDND